MEVTYSIGLFCVLGVSYNPSYTAHKELLETIASKETDLIKKDEHLIRVTSKMFQKVPRAQAEVKLSIFTFFLNLKC